jgi:DNA (cytosine-5)-methyltransferase 1
MIMSVVNGDIPEYDFLLGGFPCQPFSIAGLKKGFDDPKGRGTLIDDVVRILEEAKEMHGQPAGFLLENVKNLVDLDGGAVYEIIKQKLETIGYHVDYRVYNSLDFGIPQSRKRVYIIGFRDKEVMDRFEWPTPGQPSKRKVRDILDSNVDALHYYNNKPLFERIKDDVTNPDYVYLYRRNHVREHKTGYAPTLVASMGQGGHNVPIIKDAKGLRRLTPRECARLQGYDDLKIPLEMSVGQIYKQIGNSVSVPVMHALAVKIAKALNTPEQSVTESSPALQMSNIS